MCKFNLKKKKSSFSRTKDTLLPLTLSVPQEDSEPSLVHMSRFAVLGGITSLGVFNRKFASVCNFTGCHSQRSTDSKCLLRSLLPASKLDLNVKHLYGRGAVSVGCPPHPIPNSGSFKVCNVICDILVLLQHLRKTFRSFSFWYWYSLWS